MIKFVKRFCFHLFSEEIRYYITYPGFFFFLIALTAFLRLMPAPSALTTPNPRSDPLLRIDPGDGLLWTLWCAENSME